MTRDSMTLDEVIQFTKQALGKVNPDKRVYYEFRFTVEQVKRLLAFLQELKLFRETFGDVKNTKFCIPECKEGCKNLVKQYESKNAELKRLLKLAVDDLDTAIKSCEQDMLCEICSYHEKCDCINYCGGEYDRTWKHHDEAMELLGGTENAEN